SVTVRYRILDASLVEVYNQTNSIASIASGVTTTVTFPSTTLAAGTYTIKAKAELGTDTVPGNDEITGTLSVENPLTGTIAVGTSGTYTTLTTAINRLNQLGISRATTLLLTDASYPSETFPL